MKILLILIPFIFIGCGDKTNQQEVMGKEVIKGYSFNIVCNKNEMAYYMWEAGMFAPVIDENGFVKCSTIKGK